MRIRFRANNPGVWLFHCHTESHLDRGMALMIHVSHNLCFKNLFKYLTLYPIIYLHVTKTYLEVRGLKIDIFYCSANIASVFSRDIVTQTI